jgi:putative transposon-encoded protein
MAMSDKKDETIEPDYTRRKVKFEVYGEEMIEKTVNSSGNSGRVYLPPEWIGTKVKVIKC